MLHEQANIELSYKTIRSGSMNLVLAKIILALRNTKFVYRSDHLYIGYNMQTLRYDLYTLVSPHRLLYFDSAKTYDELQFKLQVLK